MKEEDNIFGDPLPEWPLCRFCAHLHNLVGRPTCAAFPSGIPPEVWSGSLIHNRPFPDQENDVVLTPW